MYKSILGSGMTTVLLACERPDARYEIPELRLGVYFTCILPCVHFYVISLDMTTLWSRLRTCPTFGFVAFSAQLAVHCCQCGGLRDIQCPLLQEISTDAMLTRPPPVVTHSRFRGVFCTLPCFVYFAGAFGLFTTLANRNQLGVSIGLCLVSTVILDVLVFPTKYMEGASAAVFAAAGDRRPSAMQSLGQLFGQLSVGTIYTSSNTESTF